MGGWKSRIGKPRPRSKKMKEELRGWGDSSAELKVCRHGKKGKNGGGYQVEKLNDAHGKKPTTFIETVVWHEKTQDRKTKGA